MDLIDNLNFADSKPNQPLADAMRPLTLDEFIGQDKIISKGRLLRRAIEADKLSSIIFYGPPGVGKTTLARIIANTTCGKFISINAVLAGIKDIRESIELAKEQLNYGKKKTILFIDEVHRFNKSQQDALLPHVETGLITLIGATTQNPYFEVNKALISRFRIFLLKKLKSSDLEKVIDNALLDKKRGFGNLKITIQNNAKKHLIKAAYGDARSALNALEIAVLTSPKNAKNQINLTLNIIEESIQKRAVLYDKDGDSHYDTISAFIKSIRGSDPDAALFWLAKMVYSGEDPRFIFRRMLILASEDIGLADPNALGIVLDAAKAFDYVGMPEGRFFLSQAALYLSTAKKSNTTLSFFDALKAVETSSSLETPNHLKDPARDSEDFGHGKNYLYPHAYKDHFVQQRYLPKSLQGKVFYNPSNQGYEKQIADDVIAKREAQIEMVLGKSNNQSDKSLEKIFQQRTFENKSDFLLEFRDSFFKELKLKKDSLVLDLNAKTGFLTNQAMRKIKTGGVVCLVDEKSNLDILKNNYQTQELKKPTFIYIKNKTILAIKNQIKTYSFSHIILKDFDSKLVKFWSELARQISFGAILCFAKKDLKNTSSFSDYLTGENKDTLLEVKKRKLKQAKIKEKKLFKMIEKNNFKSIKKQINFKLKKTLSPNSIQNYLAINASLSKEILQISNSNRLKKIEQELVKKVANQETFWYVPIEIYKIKN